MAKIHNRYHTAIVRDKEGNIHVLRRCIPCTNDELEQFKKDSVDHVGYGSEVLALYIMKDIVERADI